MPRPVKKPFVQVDIDFHQSAAFLAFARQLRPSLPERERGAWIAVAHLCVFRAWASCIQHVSDGNVSEMEPEIVEEWAGFRGVPGAFHAAFVQHLCHVDGDSITIRGWEERYGAIAHRRVKDVVRKRLAAASRRNSGGDSTGNAAETEQELGEFPESFRRKPSGKRYENVPRSKRLEENYYPSPDGEGPTDAFASSAPCPSDIRQDPAPCPPDMRPDIAGAAPHAAGFEPADFELLDADLDLSPPAPHASEGHRAGVAIAAMPMAAPAVAPAAARPARKRLAPRAPAAPDGVSAATESPAATGKREPREPKYPHFPHEVRAELMAVWRDQVMPLREDQRGRFVKAFAGWFAQPESERPAHLPSNAEVVDALRVMLEARKECYGSQHLHVPNYAAERIGLVVEILRETFDDPFQRLNRLERALALKPILRHDAPPPGRR